MKIHNYLNEDITKVKKLEKYLVNELASEASANTKLQEGLHCVCLAIRQRINKDIDFDIIHNVDIFFNNLNKKYYKVDASEDDMYNFSLQSDWLDSIIANTNALFNSGWLKKRNYIFHRNSIFMQNIYQQFNKLKKIDNIKLANDKWNPGDIWASTINNIPLFDNIIEYNKFISDNLKKGTLISISLKKSKGTPKVIHQGSNNKVEIINYKGIKKPKFIFSTGTNIITSKKKTEINFRSFRISKQSDITGEIIIVGSSARHGKVPSSIKNKIIKKYNIPQIKKQRISKMTDNELKNNVVNLWKQCGYSYSQKEIDKSWEKRENNIQDRVGYWQSIIHALELSAFLNNNKGQANDIINKFWIGAISMGEFSSEFIKVY